MGAVPLPIGCKLSITPTDHDGDVLSPVEVSFELEKGLTGAVSDSMKFVDLTENPEFRCLSSVSFGPAEGVTGALTAVLIDDLTVFEHLT